MNKRKLVLIVAIVLSVLAGCGGNSNAGSSPNEEEETNTEEVTQTEEVNSSNTDKEEFLSYLDQMLPLMTEADTYLLKYEEARSQSANGEIDDLQFYDIIFTEVLPGLNEASAQIEMLAPPANHPEFHETVIDIYQQGSLAMTELMAAIDQQDASKVTTANTYLAESRKGSRELFSMVEALEKEYGISIADMYEMPSL